MCCVVSIASGSYTSAVGKQLMWLRTHGTDHELNNMAHTPTTSKWLSPCLLFLYFDTNFLKYWTSEFVALLHMDQLAWSFCDKQYMAVVDNPAVVKSCNCVCNIVIVLLRLEVPTVVGAPAVFFSFSCAVSLSNCCCPALQIWTGLAYYQK